MSNSITFCLRDGHYLEIDNDNLELNIFVEEGGVRHYFEKVIFIDDVMFTMEEVKNWIEDFLIKDPHENQGQWGEIMALFP